MTRSTPPSAPSFPLSSLEAVDRALAELRRGGTVLLRSPGLTPDEDEYALVLAAEAAEPRRLEKMAALATKPPTVVVTGRRAMVLGLVNQLRPVEMLIPEALVTVEQVSALADPLNEEDPGHLTLAQNPPSWARAAVTMAKLGRLLPAVVAAPAAKPIANLFVIDTDQVMGYQQMAARSLKCVGSAKVPLADAEQARVMAFRPADGGIEHLAIVIGDLKPDAPVLTRLHSECFTGDILGSLRCDCGDQLRGAIAEIARNGAGVLLYLAQEGRGIGLVNKLRAYQLQDDGFDTLDANLQLGFDDDERIYLPAAEILRLLGVRKVRLLTNNPAKVEGLARHGVEVTERVPHIFPSNPHNVFYLKTKATRSGHLF